MIVKPLTEFCTLNMGQSPDSKTYNGQGNGLPFYQGNADFGEVHPETRVWCSAPVKIAEAGDILISVRAPIGAMNMAVERCCIGRGLAALTPISKKCTRLFLYYALQSKVDSLIAQGTGSTFKAISKKVLEATLIPAYSIHDQELITATISHIDRAIAARRNQLFLLDQLVKSRFIELFESKPWETVRAGTIMFDMRNGISPSNIGTHPAKVLTLSAITQGDFDPEAWKDGMFDTVPPIEKRVTASDFYMCRGNGNKNLVGAGVYSKEDRYDLVFPDTAIAATVDLQRACLPYLFHAWKRPSVREQIEMGARTTNGTYKINQGVVSNIELILPPLELQKQFAAFVEQTDKSKLCGVMEVAA